MQPSTPIIQTPPTQPRPSHGGPPPLPSRAAPDRFGIVLTQALEPSGVAAAIKPAEANPAAVVAVKPPLEAAPTLPAMLTAPIASIAVDAVKPAVVDKPVNGGPACPAAEAKQIRPTIDPSKTSDVAQPLPQPQPQPQPALPAPPQALMAPAQTVGTSANVTEDAMPNTPDATPPITVGSVDRQPPAIPAAAATPPSVQPTTPASIPPAHAAPSPGVDATSGHPSPGQPATITAGDKLAAEPPSIVADTAPVPAVALSPPLAAVPTVIAAPHHASVLAAAVTRSSSSGEPPASVASQVGPALASFAASAAHSGGPQNMVIRLDPMELGRVQVHIERSPDGSARVDLVVERPDTLLLLLRDQPHLHRALDLAGVPTADRRLEFHLTPPSATTTGASTPQSNADQGPGQQRPGQPRSNRTPNSGTVFSQADPAIRPPASRRAGVDITA